MYRLRAFIVLVLAAGGGSLWSNSSHAVERSSAYAAAARSIMADQLQRHVDVLADDTFEGREAGSRGGHAAAIYLQKHLSEFGLRGAGDGGGYFQTFYAGYRNILGVLEGSDPELKNEYVLIGGHYDHVGYGSPRNSYGPTGYIHNGADDNASGVSGLLELVEAYRSLPTPPRRSILFAFWDGEEGGLIGSKHWAANPTLPLEQIAFAFNVDMIGRLRDDRMEVFGSRTGAGLQRLIAQQNQDVGLLLKFDWEMKANSDHHSFFARNIPVLMFHTGLHDNYHRPSDDAHLVNSEGMERVAQLLFHVSIAIANAEQRIAFRTAAHGESNLTKQAYEAPIAAPAPRLGVAWRTAEEAGPGLLVDHVTAGSAAQLAGIAAGDRLLQFNGRPITDKGNLSIAVLAAVEPVTFLRQRAGAAETDQVRVTLTGNPMRIGISWRPDTADQSAVVVTLVTPGSAADQAGLQLGDRIYEIRGEPFQGSDDLLKKLVSLPGEIELTIGRQGRVQALTLPNPAPIQNTQP